MKRIVPHDTEWVRFFETEERSLAGVVGQVATDIHHMGSTSIAAIPSKPVIDILLEAIALEPLDDLANSLSSIGYIARGEYGIAGRRYFKKNATETAPACHLHCYLAGSHQIKRHLAFRDYLRLNPEVAADYGRLKIKLADNDGILSATYQEAKGPFVDRVTMEAMNYFDGVE